MLLIGLIKVLKGGNIMQKLFLYILDGNQLVPLVIGRRRLTNNLNCYRINIIQFNLL